MEMLFANKIKVPKHLLEEVQKMSKAEKDMYKRLIIGDAFNALNGTEIFDRINSKYNGYKKISKYISDTVDRQDNIMMWDLDHGLRGLKKVQYDCGLEKFREFVSEKEGASVWTWHHHLKGFMWLDKDVFNTECKRFRKLIKEGKLIIHEENNETHKLGDAEWHCFVVQSSNEDANSMCPASLNLFGMGVFGFVYWFNKKTNRDIVYKFLTK
jgi:hypothetical protein